MAAKVQPAAAPAHESKGVMANPELERAGEQAVSQALALIRERHESGRVPDHMHYHNSAHTAGVIERARTLGAAMGMSDRHMLLTVIAAAYHDVVQRWIPLRKEDGAVMRRRQTGRDDVASAHEAAEAMAGRGIVSTAEEQGIVASAIVATIPGWDVGAATVCQPFLIEHPVISALALADVGAAGMDPDTYGRDGPALFAEENIDVMTAVMAARRVSDIPAADQARYQSRYINWLKVQPGFARGRRQRLENGELDGFPPDVRDRVLGLMSHFDESVAIAEAAVARAEKLDFVTLMRQLDSRAFPDEPA
jgi:hypothetical protein